MEAPSVDLGSLSLQSTDGSAAIVWFGILIIIVAMIAAFWPRD
jgi:hypothetical protein